MVEGFLFRPATVADYQPIVTALGEWMPAEKVRVLLPPEYLTRFGRTCLVAWTAPAIGVSEPAELAGFLVAFPSPAHPSVGYIHFVWVSPQFRGLGLGRELYERAFSLLRGLGCTVVEAQCSRRSPRAIAFHEHLGFTPTSIGPEVDVATGPDAVGLVRDL